MKQSILLGTLILMATATSSQNLISNGGFETGNNLDCNNWYDRCGNELTQTCDTVEYCHVSFSKDAPSTIPEGNWGIKVHGAFPQTGYAETYITGISGTHVYKLQFYMISENLNGSASLGKGSQQNFAPGKTITDRSDTWQQYSLVDTVTSSHTDTITVRLRAESCDFCVLTSGFDQIELTILDTLITQVQNPKNTRAMKVHPNPSANTFNFRLKTEEVSDISIKIYDAATGKEVKVYERPEVNTLNIDVALNNQPSGVYLYVIEIDGQVYKRGKLVLLK